MVVAEAEMGSGLRSLLHVCAIASGGMGRVDLALRRDGDFERFYAIKRLHPESRDDVDFRTMFLDEARLAGLIRHANVVSVLDVGEDEEGPYLIMDYVEGLSLQAILEHHLSREELMPVQLCVRIAAQVADGLHAAHELKTPEGQALALVHRDVSPHNVLVGYDGVVRVTDFGVARALGRKTRTSTGVLKGKLGYMSPEQLRFERPDRRSDLFALGVVLYELLASRRLYPIGMDMEGPRRVLNEPPPDIDDVRKDVPEELVELLFRLLAKDPDLRPSSAQEVAERLETVLADLVGMEGAVDLAEYMETVFGQHRREEQERRAAIVREKAAEWHQESAVRLRRPSGSETSSTARGRWLWGSLGVGALVVAAVLGAMAFSAWGEQGAATTPQLAAPPAVAISTDENTGGPVVDPTVSEAPAETGDDPASTKRSRKRAKKSTGTSGNRPWVNEW